MAEEHSDQPPIDSRAVLMERLYADPEVGPELDRIIKAKFPHAQIPRHDARVAGQSAIAEVHKVREEWRSEVQKDLQERHLKDARTAVVEAGLARREDLPAIEKLMTERAIGTHEDAARLLSLERAVAEPRSAPDMSGWDVPGHLGAGGDEYKGIIGTDGKANPRWARSKALDVINELEAAKRGQGKWL